jgi:hypothetical protein
VEIEFTYARDQSYWNDYVRRLNRRALTTWYAGSAGLVVLAPAFAYAESGVLSFCILLSLAIYAYRNAELLRRKTSHPHELWLMPRTWSIDEEGFRTTSEMSSVWLSWGMVAKVIVTPVAYGVVDRVGNLWDIPREPLGADGELALHQILAARDLALARVAVGR